MRIFPDGSPLPLGFQWLKTAAAEAVSTASSRVRDALARTAQAYLDQSGVTSEEQWRLAVEFFGRIDRAKKQASASLTYETLQMLQRAEHLFGQRHLFWYKHRPQARLDDFPAGFPAHLFTGIPDVDPMILRHLADGYATLVGELEEYLKPGGLKDVDDAEAALNRITALLKEYWPPAAVFPHFYGGIVTVKVRELLERDFFKAPDFMRLLPAKFARLYLEALHLFLTNPDKLKEERPAWYLAFVHAIQGHLWSPLHGSLGICAHIIADLAIGICDALLETYKQWRIDREPDDAIKEELRNQPMSFYADELFDPKNEESVAWLGDREHDHYLMRDVLEDATPPVITQFSEDWKDAMSLVLGVMERMTAPERGANGFLSRLLALPKIHTERDFAWVYAMRMGRSVSTRWNKVEITDVLGAEQKIIETSYAHFVQMVNLRAMILAETLTGRYVPPV